MAAWNALPEARRREVVVEMTSQFTIYEIARATRLSVEMIRSIVGGQTDAARNA